jgi:hypothetical protein
MLMPETKTPKRRPAPKKPAKKQTTPRKGAGPKARANHSGNAVDRTNSANAADRTTELAEEVFKSLDDGARTAIEAVRRFVATVDKALPPRGEGPSRREEVTDSALDMAERLVHTQAEFLRKVVDSAGKSLTGSGGGR